MWYNQYFSQSSALKWTYFLISVYTNTLCDQPIRAVLHTSVTKFYHLCQHLPSSHNHIHPEYISSGPKVFSHFWKCCVQFVSSAHEPLKNDLVTSTSSRSIFTVFVLIMVLPEHFSVVHEHWTQSGHNIFKSVKRLLDYYTTKLCLISEIHNCVGGGGKNDVTRRYDSQLQPPLYRHSELNQYYCT